MQFAGFCLITEDVLRLVSFYEKVFASRAEGDVQHAEFCFAGVNLAVFSKQGMEEMAPGCMQEAGYGSVTLMFAVEDVDVEFERLKALGVDMVKPPQNHAWGARSLWFKDPDGNIIDFMCKII